MARSESHVSASLVLFVLLNVLQIVAALIVIGLCAWDISDDSRALGRSVFTIVAGSLSAVVASALLIETFHTARARVWLVLVFMWQWSMVSLWAVALGLLAPLYFRSGADKTSMSAAAGWALVNLILWFFGAVAGSVACCQRRRKHDDDLLNPPGKDAAAYPLNTRA